MHREVRSDLNPSHSRSGHLIPPDLSIKTAKALLMQLLSDVHTDKTHSKGGHRRTQAESESNLQAMSACCHTAHAMSAATRSLSCFVNGISLGCFVIEGPSTLGDSSSLTSDIGTLGVPVLLSYRLPTPLSLRGASSLSPVVR